MGNCVSRDTRADSSSDISNSNCRDDLELDFIDNGIARRIRNDSFSNLSTVRRSGTSERALPFVMSENHRIRSDGSTDGRRRYYFNMEDAIRSDNVDDQIPLEESAGISDIVNIHSESSTELNTFSESLPITTGLSPLFRQIRDISNEGMIESESDDDIGDVIVNNNDLVGDGNDSIGDLDISFENDAADSSDKRVYFDGNSCEICVSEYDEKSHKPVILPCGHVICLNCVRKIVKRNNYYAMECPMDRNIHSIKVTIAGKTVLPTRNIGVDQFAGYINLNENDPSDSLEVYRHRETRQSNNRSDIMMFTENTSSDATQFPRNRLNGTADILHRFTINDALVRTSERHTVQLGELSQYTSSYRRTRGIRRNNGSANLALMQHIII